MTASLYSLMGFVFWTIILLLGIGGIRVSQVMAGKTAPNAFPSGVPHGSEFYWRLNRAHANCLENLPLFAAVVLTAYVAGIHAPIIDTLSRVVVFARIGQSLAHLSSGSNMAVNVRFSFFLVQVASIIWMGLVIVL